MVTIHWCAAERPRRKHRRQHHWDVLTTTRRLNKRQGIGMVILNVRGMQTYKNTSKKKAKHGCMEHGVDVGTECLHHTTMYCQTIIAVRLARSINCPTSARRVSARSRGEALSASG